MQNVATLSLESPYYGARKPPAQRGSKLQRVSDLLMLGRATIEESLFLLAWAQRQGFARLGAAPRQHPSRTGLLPGCLQRCIWHFALHACTTRPLLHVESCMSRLRRCHCCLLMSGR